MQMLKSLITDVLTALYQPFWFAFLFSAACMFVYLYAYGPPPQERGLKGAFAAWMQAFRKSLFFRKLWLLSFFTIMILFRTLLNRNMWANPLSNVLGNWWIWRIDEKTGERVAVAEGIENFIMMLPFTFLLLWTFGEKRLGRHNPVLYAAGVGFLFSLSIEFAQLFLRLGNFQLSDLFHNTLGGLAGGILYALVLHYQKKAAKKSHKNKNFQSEEEE